MAKNNIGFLSLFLLFLHLNCFVFTPKRHRKPTKKRESSPLSPHSHKHRKAICSPWTFFKRLFSSTSTSKPNSEYSTPTLTSTENSLQSLVSLVMPPETHLSDSDVAHSHQIRSESSPESDISSGSPFFTLRNDDIDIFPCTACGELFRKPYFLEQHQATRHAVSQLADEDLGNNVVRIIFETSWTDNVKKPEIHRVLKVHNSPEILTRFEEYRELVKSKAAGNGAIGRRDERCMADGNELLRFNCSTFTCDLGVNGICNQQSCTVCGIIKSDFSAKMDGIPTLSTSWRAHMAIPDDVEGEFKFMNVKRAMLVCRVVAGMVGSEGEEIDKEGGRFGSVIGRGGSGAYEEEPLVFNPRAVLPCFIIVYTV